MVVGVGADLTVGAILGFFEGLTSQASSSKPFVGLFSGFDTDANGVCSERSFSDFSAFALCLKVAASTTSSFCTAGAGRPFRVLFLSAPPGPENSPPLAPLGEVDPLPPSSAFVISSPLKLTFLSFDLAPVRPYFESKYLVTLRISPSFRPSVRKTVGVISGSILSSMESRLKLNAYLSHW